MTSSGGFLCFWIITVTAATSFGRRSVSESNFSVTGLVGEKVDLPCNVDIRSCGEVYFVTWTKNVSNEWKRLYLYSDHVEKPLQEFSNPDRADFYVEDSTSYLRISPLKIEDKGSYKCDVTYVQGKCPSLSYTSLIIMAKPSQPIIKKDGKPLETSVKIGPFFEGDTFSLECITFGGKPIPEVSWWNNKKNLLVEPVILIDEAATDKVIATIRIILSRKDLEANLSCCVKNEAINDPLVSWIEVDLHVKPSSMEVEGPTFPVIEGDKLSLNCTIEGAKPAATAIWYNHSEIIQPQPSSQIKPAGDGSFQTISRLEIVVSRYDHKGKFYCKGSNPVVEKERDPPSLKFVEIEVFYPPTVVVEPQEGITVKETENATVFCTFDANPSEVNDVTWYKERVQLSVDDKDRFELKNVTYPTLVIHNVTRSDSGMYSCRLANKIGRGNPSEDVEIIVLYSPVVEMSVSPAVVNENDGTAVTLRCLVTEGNPWSLLRVRWYKNDQFLNETMEDKIELENIGREMSAKYTCEAENSAGWGNRADPQALLVNYLPGLAVIIEVDPPAVKGRTITFQCLVEDPGRPPATLFRWEHDRDLLRSKSQNYTTDPVRLSTRGNYTCAAVNDVGSGPKGFIRLIGKAPPSVIDSLPPIHGAPKDASDVSISCRIECDPLCDIEWLRNGESIMDNDLFFVKTTVHPEEFLTNRFKSVVSTLHWNLTGGGLNRNNDNANYTCRSNGNIVGPGVYTSTYFKVEYPPENITLSTTWIDVVEREVPDKVKCKADSWPPSEYIWKYSNFVIADTSELFLNYSIPRERAGFYECVASNRHGQASMETLINVMYKPECIMYESKNDQEQTTLICEVQANPEFVNFTWMKDNETFEELAKFEERRSILTLPEAAPKYFGTYYCTANNSIGESVPCSIEVTGIIGTSGWVPDFGDENVIIIAAVVVAVVVVFIIVVLVIIMIMKKRRIRHSSSPSKKKPPGKPSYQNIPGNGKTGPENGNRPSNENAAFSQRAPRGERCSH
ncbi:hemicentin-2-like isoform X2 [Tachypleus tridentatus]|uniref:hemicentin-2-like isoform X2 n=1 Tax=Tachypleus tridentatus TaxID=6853 RepID=UPI003FD2CB83